MHESSLTRGLVAQVERVAKENAATKVVSVEVWVGALAQISPDHLKEHFAEAARGSLAAGADLKVDQSKDVRHVQAQEIVLKGVEVCDRENT